MAYFLTGLGYGVMILGALMSLAGGIIVIVSLCSFMSWIGDKIAGGDAEDESEEEQQDE